MITQLQERHRPLFLSLTPEETTFVWDRVHARWPGDFTSVVPPDSPDHLFTTCQRAGLDHARVVLSFANLNGSARPVLEKLIGKPITPWGPSVEAAQEAARAACGSVKSAARGKLPGSGAARQAPAAPRKVDARLVLSVAPQPHKAGTLMYAGYGHWAVGKTVQDCRGAGLLRKNISRDVRRGYVVLGAPK